MNKPQNAVLNKNASFRIIHVTILEILIYDISTLYFLSLPSIAKILKLFGNDQCQGYIVVINCKERVKGKRLKRHIKEAFRFTVSLTCYLQSRPKRCKCGKMLRADDTW